MDFRIFGCLNALSEFTTVTIAPMKLALVTVLAIVSELAMVSVLAVVLVLAIEPVMPLGLFFHEYKIVPLYFDIKYSIENHLKKF